MLCLPQEVLQPVHALIYKSCLHMNDEAWNEYLALCDKQSFRYRVVNYSPEMRKEQVWADRDYKAMKSGFDLLPRHNSDHSKLTRHVSIYTVDYDEQAKQAHAVSALTIYRTQLDGTMSYIESGQTSLYAVGVYRDRISLNGDSPKLLERVVRLDTRQLDVGTHKPF